VCVCVCVCARARVRVCILIYVSLLCTSIEELGKYHQNVELSCNVVSLLTNLVGYHFLIYADFRYQNRFSCNLYNTLTHLRGIYLYLIVLLCYYRKLFNKLYMLQSQYVNVLAFILKNGKSFLKKK